MGIFKKPKRVIPKETDSGLADVAEIEKHAAESSEEGQLALDVFQTKDEIVVVAPVAGVKKDDLKIAIDDDVLTVQGSRHFSFNVEHENYYHQECHWGNFSRSVVLPESVDIRHVKATFKDGVLVVRVPKVERPRNKTIDIE